MASINKHFTGYRVSWYDSNYKQNQDYFFGDNAEQLAIDRKSEIEIKYPNQRSIRPLRGLSTKKNKSGIVGVFYCKNKSTKSGIVNVYPSWTVSLRRDSVGEPCNRTINFYLHKEASSEAAFEKAVICRVFYEECLNSNRINKFWEEYK